MSTTVDQRVVEMRFDNKQFEQNVATTMSSLEKLKQSLNLSGAAKGLESVGEAAKKIDMSGLSGAAETIQAKFSAMEVMSVTAIANITNSAVNAGKRIASALTIDPVKTGFSEYETKIGAIQTIMSNTASKGTTMADVTKVIGELNEYADKTIYNFAEMTRNIGTFTAAGVGLEESAAAIQGIANLAAASGSTSQQASTAMYQLSQALAAGTVKLMDWNSVVNAGMGGEKFQEALKDTAREFGVNVDAIIKKSGSFRESLQQGWITADVLNTTLQKFTTEGAKEYAASMMASGKWTQEQADALMAEAVSMEEAATKVKTFTQLWDTLKESAQSGWAQSWELIVGNFEEAKEFLSEASDVLGGMIGESAQSRNDLLFGALSSGWDQLLNQGIHDAEGFKEVLAEVAGEHDAELAEMLKSQETFREALKSGRVTGDMLATSVSKFTEKVAGMSQEQLEACGYTNEQVETLQKLNSEIQNGTISMDQFVGLMTRSSGRELLIDALWNSFNALLELLAPVQQAYREVFPETTSEQLYGMIAAVTAFTEKLTISTDTADYLKRTFRGLFAVADMVRQLFVAMFRSIDPLVERFTGLSGGILESTAKLGDWLYELSQSAESMDVFGDAMTLVVDFIEKAIDGFDKLVEKAKEIVVFPGLEAFHAFLANVYTRMEQVGLSAGNMGDGVSGAIVAIGDALAECEIVQALETMWDGVIATGSGIVKTIQSVIGAIVDNVKNAGFDNMFDFINTLSLTGIGVLIAKFVKQLTEMTDIAGSFKEGILGILNDVRGCFEAYQSSLKADALLKIAGAIAILTASLVVIGTIDSEKLSDSLGAVTILFADLMASMAIFGKISGELTGVIKATTIMIGASTAVLILASALKTIGELDFNQMMTGLVGVIGLTGTLVGAIKLLGMGGKSALKGATQMVIFAAAVKVLASVCTDLSALNPEQLAKGLTGVGVLVAEMAAFMNLAGNASHVVATGVAMIALGAAMKIFASAVSDFATMNWDQLGRGLTAMALGLAAVTAAVNFMPKNMVAIGVGLIGVSTAMVILSNALVTLGGQEWENIAKGLVSMGGAVAVLAVGLNAMNGTLAGSAAMLVAAGALAVMTPMLSILGAMSWEGVAKGLVTLAGAFTVIGIAGLVLTPIVGSILALAGAITLIGVGALGIGAGLMAAAAGISALAIGITALVTALSGGAAAIAASLTVIITGVASMIPAVLAKIGEGIVEFCSVIANGAPMIAEAFRAVVLNLVDVLTECVPAVADGALVLISGLLAALAAHTPGIVDSLFRFVIGIIDGIAEHMPDLVAAGVNVLVSFFAGVIDALKGLDTDVIASAVAGAGLLSAFILAMGALTPLIPGAMVGILGMGALIAELALVLAAVGAIAHIPGLDWLVNEGASLLGSIGNAIGSFVGGVIGGTLAGVTGQFPQIGTDLAGFMTNIHPFVDGAKNIDASLLDGVSTLAEAIVILTGASVVSGIASWLTGGSSISAFADDLAILGPSLKAYSDSVAGLDGAVVKNSTNAALALATFANNLPNTGGIVSWFAGDNDISAFGESLVSFGRNFAAYSNHMKSVDAGIVATTTNAASSIVQLQKSLPKDGGWFSDETTLAEFGSDMSTFGSYFSMFYTNVSGVNVAQLSGVIAQMNALVAMASGMASLNTSAMTSFGFALTSMANNGVNGFISAFTNAKTTVVVAMEGFLMAVNTEITSKSTVLKTNMGSLVIEMSNTITTKRYLFVNAGKNIMEGLEIGIQSNQWRVVQASSAVALAAYSAAMEAIGAHSPATKFIEVGMYADQGLAKGLTDYSFFVTNACSALGASLLAALQKKLAIESPSKVTRDEVGRYVVQGIAEGITADMSAEQAAAKKAQNIVNAFKTELDKFDLDKSTAELEYELWTKLNGATATEAEKAAANLGLLATKLQLKAEQVQLAQAEYQTTLDNLGANAEATQTAYNKFLQAQIDIAELSSQMTQAQNAEAQRQRDAMKNYYQLLGEYQEKLMSHGFTQEEIEKWARSESGYDPAMMTNNMTADVQAATTTAMTTVQTVYAETAETTFGSLMTNFSGWGASYAESLAIGIQNGAPGLQTAVTTLTGSCANTIKATQPSWFEAGGYLVDGMIAGIESKREAAISAATSLASAMAAAVSVTLDINSPSGVFEDFGMYSVLGLVRGLDRYAYLAKRSATDLANKTSNGMSVVVNQIADALNGDMDLTPTIRPVVDLSDVEKGAKLATKTLGIQPGLRVSGITARVSSVATSVSSKNAPATAPTSEKVSQTTSYNFTQNNYSPKSLSRLDIYRQTKNQFSALKGAVK